MAQLAIKGHKTRGKEVIEILEMMGYVNCHKYSADCDSLCFYGGENTSTIYYDWVNNCEDIHIFTLEEFLEKFPYKIGDKVTLDKWPCTITGMSWEYDDIIYYVQGIDFSKGVYSKDKDLQPYKETMNIKIAIKGHKTRGKEVIEILEMLGGVNTYKYSGDNEEICFCIGCATKMIYYEWINDCYGDESIFVFSLEEFLEKYPYKVGDKVTVTGLPEYPKIIKFVEWFDGDIHYSFDNETWFLPSELILYKEETMETITIDDFKANTKEWLIDKLHDMVISKAIKTIGDIHEELHKPQYPKTYDECVNMFNCTVETVNLTTIAALRELIYCRNAYWKIAGEQMGLGKPWEPDWDNLSASHEFITINKGCFVYSSKVLVFPTKEMCDVFHENFKELIEKCKEFL